MSSEQAINSDPDVLVPGATTTTGMLVACVRTESPQALRSFETLVRIIRNVLDHPGDIKYHEVRKASPAFRDHVAGVAPCAQLLRRMGFRDEDEVYRLQRTGIRRSEVARLQAALHNYVAFAGLVQQLAPVLQALGLNWSREDGSETFLPFWPTAPSYAHNGFFNASTGQRVPLSLAKKSADMFGRSKTEGQRASSTQGDDVWPFVDEAREEKELQEALRLSRAEGGYPSRDTTAASSSSSSAAPAASSSCSGGVLPAASASSSSGAFAAAPLSSTGALGSGSAHFATDEEADLQEAMRLSLLDS